MSSPQFHTAIEKAVADLGIDVLKSPNLVGILSDYNAFEVHDPLLADKKAVIKELVKSGFGDKLIKWKRKKHNWKEEKDIFIVDFKKNNPSFDPKLIESVVASFTMILPQNSAVKTKRNPIKKSRLVKKAETWLLSLKIDTKKIFRIFLYVITVCTLMQVMCAVFRVTSWGVWSWSLYFIGHCIGYVGFLVVVLLPAIGAVMLFVNFEQSATINLKKTNALLILLNVAGICGLYAMSLGYDRLWSWHHIYQMWIVLRPLVFVLLGIVGVCIALMAIGGIGWVLGKIRDAIVDFFHR